MSSSSHTSPPNPVSAVRNTVATIQQEAIGNVQLIEARLLELYSSIRALYRSNQELLAAISTDDQPDPVFLEALEENWDVLRRQRLAAMQLVTELKQRGLRNFDLPADICDMDVPAHTTAAANSTASNRGQQLAAVDEEDSAGSGEGAGVFL